MRIDRVLLDIELQRDFFSPGGSCFSSRSLEAGKNVRRLFAWARRRQAPVLSVLLRCRPRRIGPLAKVPHCVDGTAGEKRISGTLLARHVNFGMRNVTDLPANVFADYQQVIIERRHTDIFRHARAERLLTQLDAKGFVVCGAGSAGGIVEAVVGLRARGFDVTLASDAILDLDSPDAEYAWLRMLAKGAVPLATDEIVRRPDRRRRPRQCATARHFCRGGPALTR